MRGKELLDKMELIDPAYVEAAGSAPERKAARPKRVKWIVAAACICALLAVTTGVLAETGLGTKLIRFFTSKEESGYELAADIVKFPANVLKGDIKEVPAAIRQQFASWQPYMDAYPGSWQRAFDTRDEACDFIGFDKIKRFDLGVKEERNSLEVQGTENGDITFVSIETHYKEGDIRMQLFTNIYTENEDGDVTFSSVWREEVGFTEDIRTTSGGKTLHVMEQTAIQSGYLSKTGYIVDEGILYHFHVVYLEKDAARADELLTQWAEMF